MKRLSKQRLLLTILFLVFFACPLMSVAQPEPGCTPDNYRWTGTEWVYCPIDNGVYILFAFAVIYGIKKGREKKVVRK